MMNIREGQKVMLYISKREGNSTNVVRKKKGTIVGTCNGFVIVQHEHYKECYFKKEFLSALTPGGTNV